MASEYRRLLDLRKLGPNQNQREDTVWDAGAYRVIEADCRVPVAGTGGNLILQHAAVNEPDAFRDLSGASWSVGVGATGAYLTVTNFLRFIRWRTDGAVAGNPSAIIDLIGKE